MTAGPTQGGGDAAAFWLMAMRRKQPLIVYLLQEVQEGGRVTRELTTPLCYVLSSSAHCLNGGDEENQATPCYRSRVTP